MTDTPTLIALTPTQHATLLEALNDAYDYRIGSAPGLNDDNLERAEDRDVKARYEELMALVTPRPVYVADTDTAPAAERKAAPRRCEANTRRGTGTGICDRALDVHGGCDRAADHLD